MALGQLEVLVEDILHILWVLRILYLHTHIGLGGRDNSVGIATRYGLDPASCTVGTGSFPGVKRPGRGADPPVPSKCRGLRRVRLYLYSPYGP